MRIFLVLASLLLLMGCAPPSLNRYGESEVGKSSIVVSGVVTGERLVAIQGKNSGAGALIGGTAGGFGGSFLGSGSGSIGGLLAGAILGGLAGAASEQALANRDGVEYMIKEETGATVTLVQNIAKDDPLLPVGSKVLVQTQGAYNRVFPAAPALQADAGVALSAKPIVK